MEFSRKRKEKRERKDKEENKLQINLKSFRYFLYCNVLYIAL